jgi:hypothetical protein
LTEELLDQILHVLVDHLLRQAAVEQVRLGKQAHQVFAQQAEQEDNLQLLDLQLTMAEAAEAVLRFTEQIITSVELVAAAEAAELAVQIL